MIYLHLKLIVNLTEKWEIYKAAKLAISSTVDSSLLITIVKQKCDKMHNLQFPVGLLALENFMDYSKLILNYDAILRWFILHSGIFYSMSNRGKGNV